MTLEEITGVISGVASNAEPIGATVKFDFGDVGQVFVDGTGDSNVSSNEDNDADCVLIMDVETYQKLKDGELNPMMAVMGGKVKIKGDTGIAMKLQSFM